MHLPNILLIFDVTVFNSLLITENPRFLMFFLLLVHSRQLTCVILMLYFNVGNQ